MVGVGTRHSGVRLAHRCADRCARVRDDGRVQTERSSKDQVTVRLSYDESLVADDRTIPLPGIGHQRQSVPWLAYPGT